jgi:ribosomal protein S13
MAENEKIVEEVSNETPEQVDQPKAEQPRDEKGQFKSKFESAGDDSVAKVDLSKPPVAETEEVKSEPAVEETNVVEEVKEEVVESATEEAPVLEEITVEDLKETEVEAVEEKIEEAVAEAEETGKPLPENIQKLMDFMDETGGDLQDYVNLNRDVEKMDDSEVLDEYYRATKSHLTP